MENQEDDNQCNVSLDSIVSANLDNLNSGDEAPEDFTYLKEKIIKNYVIKTILFPGKGLERISKHDYVEYELFCFFHSENQNNFSSYKNLFQFFSSSIKNENQQEKEKLFRETINSNQQESFLYKTRGSLKEFMHIDKRLHIPLGLKKSFFRFRKSEISHVLCNGKYTYTNEETKKIDYEKLENDLFLNLKGEEVLKINENDSNEFYYNEKVVINSKYLIKDDDKEDGNVEPNDSNLKNCATHPKMKINKKKFEVDYLSRKLFYIVKINNFIQYFDLLGNGRMIKFLIEKGEGITTPTENDEVSIIAQLRMDNSILTKEIKLKFNLTEISSNEEIRMLSSLKRKEKSNIEIEDYLAWEVVSNFEAKRKFLVQTEKNENKICLIKLLLETVQKELEESNEEIFSRYLIKDEEMNKEKVYTKEYFLGKRFFYIIKLENFNESEYKKEVIHSGIYKTDITRENTFSIGEKVKYYVKKKKLEEGIGNNCPWENYKAWLLMKVEVNNEIVFSNYNDLLSLERISKLKSKLQKIVEEEKEKSGLLPNTQLLVFQAFEKEIVATPDKSFTKNIIYYDSYSLELPEVITHYIKTMKLLESLEIHYTGEIDILRFYVNQENEKENANKITNTGTKKKRLLEIIKNSNNFKFTFTLLNFHDNKFTFYSQLTENEIINELENYKLIANEFLSLGFPEKFELMCCNIISETTKLNNLIKKNVETEVKIQGNFLLQNTLSKIHSNYISLLYKQRKLKECLTNCLNFNEIFTWEYTFFTEDSEVVVVVEGEGEKEGGEARVIISDKNRLEMKEIKENITYFKVNFVLYLVYRDLFKYDESQCALNSLYEKINGLPNFSKKSFFIEKLHQERINLKEIINQSEIKESNLFRKGFKNSN